MFMKPLLRLRDAVGDCAIKGEQCDNRVTKTSEISFNLRQPLLAQVGYLYWRPSVLCVAVDDVDHMIECDDSVGLALVRLERIQVEITKIAELDHRDHFPSLP
jgi:hypothetical protein